MSERDYYAIVGVRRTATPDALRRAYRARARELHVDGQPLPGFRELAEVYGVLSDPTQRRAYDGATLGESIMALFETPLGTHVLELHFGGRPIDPLPGADVHMALDVPREVLEHGGVVDVTFPAASVCAKESAPLRVLPGSLNWRFVMLPNLGASGEHVLKTGAKGAPGNLIVCLNPV